ncbi:MAG: ABC transporter transmembrane domain-containing protein [Candidatus Krumholzibacteria bacterium]|nr:ABC transporter transmembrane domain-containing protein [Candidatus Krumholzibacteria bacterium]
MNNYLRMLRRLWPYLPQVLGSVALTIVFSLTSSAAMVMTGPILQAMFRSEPTTAPPTPGEAAAGPAADDQATPVAATARETDAVTAAAPLAALDAGIGLKRRVDAILADVNTWLLRGERLAALQRVVAMIFLLLLVKNLAHYSSAVMMTYVGQRVIKNMRDDVFAALLAMPLGFFHRHRAGELISRATNDVQIANKAISISVTNLVRDPLLIVSYFAVCLYISWPLTLIALLVLPLSIGVIVRIGKHLRRYSHRQQERLADLTSVLQETVYGIRVVKAFAMEAFERGRFLRESERLFRDVFKIERTAQLGIPLTEQLSAIIGIFILWYGGRQVLVEGTIAPEAFVVFMVCLFSMVHPIKVMAQVNNAIQEGMAAAERLFTILDAEPETGDEIGKSELPFARGRVQYRNVSFGYLPAEPVLRDINLEARPGEVIALVGGSGAGKSTLVDLLPRFYDPQAGEILIDGHDIRGVTLASLRRNLGIVAQEVILFNDTVRNNIAYGMGEIPPENIEAAAQAANAHEFIMRLPQGYDTVIGDRGVTLSGGERQRLSIARAILKNPPILILDEATSALDTESEQLVQQAIDRLVRNRTTFVIAHRLSTVRRADCIHTLRSGRIVESGTHDELLRSGGVYASLYNLQFQGQEQ